MEKSNEAMEIEQLKSRIEKYRKALSTLKSENSSGDIHLKRRVISLEKNVEQLNGQIQEFAKLLDEGVAYLTNEIKQLAEKSDAYSKKRENVKPTMELPRFEQRELSSGLSVQPDAHSSSQESTIPSFKQLRQLAALHPAVQPLNEPPKSPRYNASAIPTHIPEIIERKPSVQEEMDLPSRRGISDEDTPHLGDQTNRTSRGIETVQSVQQPTPLYARNEIQESPFWKKFKKK